MAREGIVPYDARRRMLAATVGRNVAEILRQLRALIHNRSTGEMMPCGWEPGKPTLPEKNDPTAQARPWESWKPRNAF